MTASLGYLEWAADVVTNVVGAVDAREAVVAGTRSSEQNHKETRRYGLERMENTQRQQERKIWILLAPEASRTAIKSWGTRE